MPIFLDTGFYFALLSKKDPHHPHARSLVKRLASWEFGRPVTSDYVLDEAMTLISMRVKGEKGNLLQKMKSLFLGEEPLGQLVCIKPTWLPEIAELHIKLATPGPSPSFTDCSTILTCKKHGIEKILSFDRHFEHFLNVIH
jgi:predicted nucleic acid-binding protein